MSTKSLEAGFLRSRQMKECSQRSPKARKAHECCIGNRLGAEEKENERWPDAASGSFCHFRRCRSPSFPCCSLWALLNIYNQQEYIQSPRIYTITKNIQSPSIYNHQEYIQSPTGVKKITNGRTKNLPEHKPNQKRKSK